MLHVQALHVHFQTAIPPACPLNWTLQLVLCRLQQVPERHEVLLDWSLTVHSTSSNHVPRNFMGALLFLPTPAFPVLLNTSPTILAYRLPILGTVAP